MHWQRLTIFQNWWSKQSPTGAISSYALLHHVFSNFYFRVNSSYLMKLGERGMPTCRCQKVISKLLVFWELFSKVQMNSKLDETWFIGSTMKSTSTPSKELNWATIWNWKINYCKHVNSQLPNRDLELFSASSKEQLIQYWELYLTRLEAKLALDH
jgi:hypothetical protein